MADDWQDVPVEHDDWQDVPVNKPAEKTYTEKALHQLGGLFSGPTAGESIPILGPIAAKAGNAVGAGVTSLFSDKKFGDLYNEAEQGDAKKAAEYAHEYPVADIGKNLAGGVMLPVPGFGQGVKAASTLGKAAQAIGRIAPQAAVSYADTGLRTLDNNKAENSAENTALISGGMELLPYLAGKLGRGAARGLTGLKGETLDKYRARRPEINGINEEVAKDSFDEAARAVAQKGDDLVSGAQQSTQKARDEALLEAQNIRQSGLDKARNAKDAGFKESDDLVRSVADDLHSGLTGARKKISQGSSDAFDKLADSGVSIPMPAVKGAFQQRINNFKIGDALPDSPEVKVLQKYRQFFDQIGEKEVSATDFKKIIQMMDAEVQDAYAAARTSGGYVGRGERELMSARKGLDQNLKTQVPEYAEAMEPVSRQTKVMGDLQDYIPEAGDSAFSRLKNVMAPGQQDKAAAIAQFEKEFGGDYMSRLQKAQGNREFDYDALAKPDLNRSKELMSEDFAPYFADQMGQGRSVQEIAAGLGPKSSQQSLQRFGNNPNKNIELGRRFDRLADEYKSIKPEANFNPRQMADDLAVKRALETPYSQGSANVNVGKSVLGGISAALGAGSKAEGLMGAVGAAIGRAADRIGPQTVKSIIDVIDSPGGQKWARMYQKASRQGPQAIELTHRLLLRNDANYKKLIEEKQP